MAQRKTYIPYYRRSCWDTAIISRKDKVPSMQLPVRVIGASLYGFRNEKIAFLITEYTKEVGSHPTAFIRRRIQLSWLCTEFSSTLDPPFRSTFIFKWSDRFLLYTCTGQCKRKQQQHDVCVPGVVGPAWNRSNDSSLVPRGGSHP